LAQKPLSPRVRALILAVSALVLIVSSIGGFFVVQQNQQVYNTNLTATANGNATEIAQSIVLATTLAATEVAAERLDYPPFTHAALFDSLEFSNFSNWDLSSDCGEAPQYGYYTVTTESTQTLSYCLNNSKDWGEIAYQVTMIVDSGDCGGLVFRYVDENDYYFLVVCQDGSYNVGYVDHGIEHRSYNGRHSSSAILRGMGKSNVIAITVQGDTITIFLNRHKVDSIISPALTTSAFSQEGPIGLLAFSFSGDDYTTVGYTNAIVWTAQGK
jgi:hypothetical protein